MSAMQQIKSWQERKGISDAELSRKLGKRSRSYLYNIWSGHTGFSASAALRLAELMFADDEFGDVAEKNAFIVEVLRSGPAAA